MSRCVWSWMMPLVGVAGVLAVPATAVAAEVRVEGEALVLTGDVTSRTYSVSATTDPHGVAKWSVFVSPGTGVTAAGGCSLDSGTTYFCPRSGVVDITFNGGDAAETLQLTSAIFASVPLRTLSLKGGDGADFFTLDQYTGAVTADMGPGNDRLVVGNNLSVAINASGGTGNDQLTGGPVAGDQLYGDDDNDRLYGRGGNDLLELGAGSDWGIGDDGDDTINGGPGDDFLAGAGQSDTLDGGSGHDTVGADHRYDGLFSDTSDIIPGNDVILLREATPERDDVYAGSSSISGGCGGGTDRVVADQFDVVPASALCELVERPQVAPAFSLTPSSQAFGTIGVGFNSLLRLFTLSNTGGPPAGGVTPAIAGPDASQFAIAADTCTGHAPPQYGSGACAVQLRFSPTSAGEKNATLELAGLSATLTGTGTTASTAPSLTPASHNFGTVTVGAESSSKDFVLMNLGTTDLIGTPTSLTGANPADFRIVLDECSGHVLAPLSACTIRTRFAPKSQGTRTATLSTAGRAATLTGTADAPTTPDSGQTPGNGQQANPTPNTPAAPTPQPTPPSRDLTPPRMTELTKAVQSLAAALHGKLTVSISTDEGGTWKVEIFHNRTFARAAATQQRIGLVTDTITAGAHSIRVPLAAQARKRLKRLKRATLTVRSTLTDAAGNHSTTTRRITLRARAT